MIKNVIFDFGNVLLKWNPDEIISHFTNKKEEHEILKSIIFQSPEWLKLDDGSLSYEKATEIFVADVSGEIKDKVKKLMKHWFEYLPVNPEIVALMKALKQKGYSVYILSNTHIPVYEYVKTIEVGKYIDGYLISAIEKMMKPDEEIYLRLFEKFHLVPEECFFIDDTEKNIMTGEKLHMPGHIFKMTQFSKLIEDLKEKGVEI